MAEKIVVGGEIVDDVGQERDEDQTLLEKEAVVLPIAEPKEEEFENEEEFTAALEQHKIDNPPEPWLATDLDDVPAQTHIRVKQKLKGTISEKNEENEKLKQRIAELEKSKPEPKVLKRPKEDDFDDDEKYEAARDQYEHDMAQERYGRIEAERQQRESLQQNKAAVDAAVIDHYKRADKLIEEAGIDSLKYKEADRAVRLAVESVLPNMGEIIVDQFIASAGEGSEKVIFFVGRNKAPLNEFKSLLMEDKTGIKAAIFLGKEQGKLTNPRKRTTRAPAPTPNLKGDDVAGSNGTALKKSYDKEYKAGNLQAAYNAKKTAKAAKVDVSKW